MPLVFIHGVNVRRTKAYRTRVGLRTRMFERLVIDPLQPRFPELSLADEIYWGDLGAKYHWNLRSVPTTRVLEDLGAGDEQKTLSDLITHDALLGLLGSAEAEPAGGGALEALGGDGNHLLVTAAKKNPRTTMAAVVDGERHALLDDVVTDDTPGSEEVTEQEGNKAESEGARIADLLLAMGDTLDDPEAEKDLQPADTDENYLKAVHDVIATHYQEPEATPDLEDLGAGDWLGDRLAEIGNGVKRVIALARRPKDSALRAASLAALAAGKDPIMDKAKFFVGDVFEYAVRGRADDAELSESVRQALQRVAEQRNADDPLIIVTHSFGSAIFYDLVTSNRFTEPVDLWVSVGAQVSFFAEMRFFRTSPDPAVMPGGDPANNRLSRPNTIERWVNAYDPADVLSFIAEPVFEGVTDAKMRDGSNVANAHGAYFGSKDFYVAIREAMEVRP